jgi:hypothetical protein
MRVLKTEGMLCHFHARGGFLSPVATTERFPPPGSRYLSACAVRLFS